MLPLRFTPRDCTQDLTRNAQSEACGTEFRVYSRIVVAARTSRQSVNGQPGSCCQPLVESVITVGVIPEGPVCCLVRYSLTEIKRPAISSILDIFVKSASFRTTVCSRGIRIVGQ